MAATDQNYRNQKWLDIVFGVTCVLMLVGVVWMFWQDYSREFKVEQRDFRDVEAAVAERQMLKLIPDQKQLEEIEEQERLLAYVRKQRDEEAEKLSNDLKKALTDRTKAAAKAQEVKAEYDSVLSLYNIAVEERDEEMNPKRYETLKQRAKATRKRLDNLKTDLDEKNRKLDEATQAYEAVKAKKKGLEDAVSKNEDILKKMTADFDRFAKLAYQKQWKFGDTFRSLPVLDAFSSPVKIQQYTLSNLPIDYNFKYVTRYDRCTTCHLGFDRPPYSKGDLRALGQEVSPQLMGWLETESTRISKAKNVDEVDGRYADFMGNVRTVNTRPPEELTGQPLASEVVRIRNARMMLRKRELIMAAPEKEKSGLKPEDITLTSVKLGQARISEFAAHPRLDLFVAAESKHPSEKFGCTICHSGQGSATEFSLASHTPNDTPEKIRWTSTHHWESNHFWDFPMLPQRFLESGCVKCHYNVTDLLPEGNKLEIREGQKIDAPGAKVVQGFNLVRENGCFGCHEIPGIKSGRWVGPDMRLEPSPAIDELSPADKIKATSDPLNPPGTFRKVGPSLRRLSEKTNDKWVWNWIHAPREFRSSTRMPHFFGLSNNNEEALNGTGQEDFPNAEIHAITHYLLSESRALLKGEDKFRQDNLARREELSKQKERPLSEQEKKDLEEAVRRIEHTPVPQPLDEILKDLPADPIDEKAKKEQLRKGRQLFSEKGCLACHQHSALTKADLDLPKIESQAHFGPDLSRVSAKLGTKPGDRASARRWLAQWIMDPKIHSLRTYMPVKDLSLEETTASADWLLSQESKPVDAPPSLNLEALKNLARISLEKSRGRQDADALLRAEGLDAEQAKILRQQRPDADELKLENVPNQSWEDRLKWYVGKKAIGAYGCFGCHDIPGFEIAKPTGTPLNDWGKKDPDRIAFEDVNAYVHEHYHFVPLRDDARDKTKPDQDWQFVTEGNQTKAPYEQFYADALEHQHREGFLHQKLAEPRSYEYNNLRTWDDRLRMPQFRFSRKPTAQERSKLTEEEKAKIQGDDAQVEKEEADAREAVMTFILSLVAEPIPQDMVYDPPKDRLAQIKGHQILDKFNCAGCHQIKAGDYEFKTNPSLLKDLEERYKDIAAPTNLTYAADLPAANHNAWFGATPPPDRVILHGLPVSQDETAQKMVVRLTQALRFPSSENKPLDIPAAEDIEMPTGQLTARQDPQGGTFTELLVPYLIERKAHNADDNAKAHAALPPPLLREGERAQPDWLFGFLRNPVPIRSQHTVDAQGNEKGVLILRMPRFSLSEEDAMALVNYFAAVDKASNPGVKLDYPYVAVKEREDDYLAKQSQPYVARFSKAQIDQRMQSMQPVWDRILEELMGDVTVKIAVAEKAANAAQGDDKKTADTRLASLRDQLKDLQGQARQKDREGAFYKEQRAEWKKNAYAMDTYRLLGNYNLCLKCHPVGRLDVDEAIGPRLDLVPSRLRPEWTQRWLASPQRLLVYPVGQHPMPQPFGKGKVEYQETFAGSSLEQATAIRDILMNLHQVADMPANRLYHPEGAK
jgi:mono/diheme cytochrome c family protein